MNQRRMRAQVLSFKAQNMKYVLSIDQGTTSSRAILFDTDLTPVATSQDEFPQIFPQSGWVEHDPRDLWATVQSTCKEAMETAGLAASDIAAIGITNQRETTVIWDSETGEPLHNAIVWQDRRTAEITAALKAEGAEPEVSAKTGLLLDPYFSATKAAWMLDRVEGARARAEAGELAYRELIADREVAKVSIVGIGMRSHAGVAQKMFRSLADEGVNIRVITTSEIKVSVLVDRKYMELAVQALHDAFELDKAA